MTKSKLSRGELLLHNVFPVCPLIFLKIFVPGNCKIFGHFRFYKFINQLNFVTSHPGLQSSLHKSIIMKLLLKFSHSKVIQ